MFRDNYTSGSELAEEYLQEWSIFSIIALMQFLKEAHL